jgi:hypothetical protein
MMILPIDDMLEAARELKLRGYNDHVKALEDAADLLGKALAEHLDINFDYANWEGKEYGGLCGTFYPKNPEQPCPQVIRDGDKGGDWEMPKPR